MRKKKLQKEFFRNLVLNILMLSAAVGVYFLIVRVMFANYRIFYPLQLLQADIVHLIQKPFTDVALAGTHLLYDGFTVEISWDCLGLRQMLFYIVLLFCFYQVRLRERLLGLVFIPVIIFANIMRITLLYPIFTVFGEETAIAVHEFLFAYGNGILVFVLFIVWFYVFALPERKQKGAKKHKTGKKNK